MENRKKYERISFIAMLVAIITVPLYMTISIYGDTDDKTDDTAKYVGRETCIECHLNEYNSWVGSHHDKAMEHANDSTVLGNFNNQSITYNGKTHKMYKRDGAFIVYTDGPDGEMAEFEVKFTFGFYPLQQYLVPFEGGRLQTLPITWDSKDSAWYHMADAIYSDEIIEHDNWLHWTNQSQNWNSMCADCHSTNLIKGYDVDSDSYKTSWSEIDVSCEACHGPASKHLEWAGKAEYARSTDNNFGLEVKTSGITNKEYVDLCVRCHARRGGVSDFIHSKDIYNHSIPNLPVEDYYHIDGQIKEEDYVYASFTQSKMYMRDVKCNDCHDVHSTKRHFEDNRLCTQCHRADDYDTYNHHFHKGYGESGNAVIADDGVKFEVGEGSKCINCHMPAQFYMGVDYRNDHSFRVPRPDLTETLGTPNACNQCHADKSTQWAIEYVNKWHGIGRPAQFGVVFKEAKTGSSKGYNGLLNIYNDDVYPEIIRAAALQQLGNYYPIKGKKTLIEATKNINGHIRYYALNSLSVIDQESLDVVLSMLNDQTKAIRAECIAKLSQNTGISIPKEYQEAYNKAKDEYVEILKYGADFPSGKLYLANYYYNTNQLDKAEEFYKRALKQDNLLHDIKIQLAMVYNSKKEFKKAEMLFKDYFKYVPNNGNNLYRYGLFLSEQKKYDESIKYLLKAAEYETNNPRIFYNIAQMYIFFKDLDKAEDYLNKAININKKDSNYYMALLNFYLQHQNISKAKSTAQTILDNFPNINNKQQIESVLTR